MTISETRVSAHTHVHTTFDPTVLALSVAIFGLFSYFVCIALSLVFPPMAVSMKLLYPALFPGFVWLTVSSVIWGAITLTIAALYVGCAFALIYNAVARTLRS